ncbi:MAG: PH domain-containing protein [Lacisediminihabitans sp.]
MTDVTPESAATDPGGLPGQDGIAGQDGLAVVPAAVAALTDGQWHRLHPASPLLRGGIVLIAILGAVVANLRERLVSLFIPRFDEGDDAVDYVFNNGFVLQALLVILVVLLVLIAGFYFSWRMHTFRITDEVVEEKSGILFRTNRKARLDRIQGINIVRPFFARLFGAAKLEINQAGQNSNLQLSYLGSRAADDLRREILRLASGTRVASAVSGPGATAGFIDRRVGELFAPELDPDLAAPESVVKIHLGRLLGSIVLSEGTVILVLALIGGGIWIAATGEYYALFIALPSLFGVGSVYLRRFTRALRYTIAGTPDGVRVGYGLLSTSNETLPPGRIHSVQVRQPLLWRPSGWWEVRVNVASHSSNKGAAGQANTTILPVGNFDEAARVVALVLPGFVLPEFLFVGPDDGFTNSPPRAVWLRPLSWRRNGFATAPDWLLLRRGAIWRQLVIVPQPRLQSVAVAQGPLLRALGLANIHLHTVAGPIRAELGAIDLDAAVAFFGTVALAAVESAQRDTSHRWRSTELPMESPGKSAEEPLLEPAREPLAGPQELSE